MTTKIRKIEKEATAMPFLWPGKGT